MVQTIVIFGATGSQGGAIAAEFLKSGSSINVLAVTRNVDSDKSRALAEAGANLVQSDMNDLDSLKEAVRGADFIFAVTDFLTAQSIEVETAQGLNLLKAAESTIDTLKGYIWSNLPDARIQPVPYQNVIHFNAKNDIAKEIRKSKVGDVLIEVRLGPYFENFLKAPQVYGPQKHSDGSWELMLPCFEDSKLPFTSVKDLGKLVEIILNDPAKFVRKTISVVSERVTPIEMLKSWNKAVNKQATFKSLSTEEFTQRLISVYDFPRFIALALAENLSMYRDDPEAWVGNADFAARDLVPGLSAWDEYVQAEDWSSYPGLEE